MKMSNSKRTNKNEVKVTYMQKDFSFNLAPIDHIIVNALQIALENDMPDIMRDNNLTEHNGYGQFRWNVIIAQLRDKCKLIGRLELDTCKRGAWKTPVLFNTDSGFIFTFMTEKTFISVQRKKDKGKHYLCGAANFNEELKPQYEQLKLDLPGISSDLKGCVYRSQEQLAQAIHSEIGEIKGHILVLFDVEADKLLSVRAVRLTHSLEISMEEENWSKFMGTPYNTGIIASPQQNNDEEEVDLVELL